MLKFICVAAIRYLFIFILIMEPGVSAAAATEPKSLVQESSAFRSAECMVDLPVSAVEGRDVVCGYLTVPEEHANPNGKTIELAVAIIKSLDPQPKPDPLVIAQGGPGGSTIDTYLNLLLGDNNLRTDRDIILFDQRGTLYSRPVLYCTEIEQMTIDTLNQNLSIEESEQLFREALKKCQQRLTAQGINLSAYDSLENAADIESLRQALGYTQINLYGVSYGTLLSLHTMRMFPSSLRSVILDGVVPTQTNFLTNVAQTMNRSFTRLFDSCLSDPDCNRNYPDLERTLFEVVDRLNREPALVKMIDPDNGTVYKNVVINGDTFLSGLFQFMYSSALIDALPRIIYDAKDGNFNVFARIFAIFLFDRTTSYGMYFSVLCAEDSDFIPADQDLTGVRPQIKAIEESSPEDFLASCDIWKVAPLDASVDAPVVSEIPTLILSGGFDPITPPDYAQSAASSLSHSFNYIFPAGGHGQALDNDCSDSIINRFLANPQAAPDATCINPNDSPQYYTSKTVVDLPIILELINLQGFSPFAFLALILALGFLWTSVLVFPLAWLVGKLSRKPVLTAQAPVGGGHNYGYTSANDPNPHPSPAPQIQATPRPRSPFLARVSSWLPIFEAIILTTFLISITATVVMMINNNDNRLFFGLPGETRILFILPWLFVLLGMVMLAAGLQAWIRRLGPIWRRIYYTLLILNALFSILQLAYLGMLSAIH